jgi:hypothetical protein
VIAILRKSLTPLQVAEDQGDKPVPIKIPLDEKEDDFIPQMRNFFRSIRGQVWLVDPGTLGVHFRSDLGRRSRRLFPHSGTC